MDITSLPEDCISAINSDTSPKDAADSDAVWEPFLPSDYREIISQSSSPNLNSLSKKSIYFSLCDHPILVADNTMAFSLEKLTSKKCYMIGAKNLYIVWVEDPRYWKWTSMTNSRFPLVAELKLVWWLEVSAKIETKLLSPNTTYGVYFVFEFGTRKNGFKNRHVELKLKFEGTENEFKKLVILDTPGDGPQPRNDGWKEVEMGEFFNEHGKDGPVHARLCTFDGSPMTGLIVEGIEFRPKSTG